MESIYAETLSSFAYDLNNLWKEKQKFKSQIINKTAGVTASSRETNNCSLNRLLISVSANDSGIMKSSSEYLTNVDRLQKTAPIWIQPDMTRVDVDKILQEFEKGVFIVRMGTDKKAMVLSYKSEEKVQHVMIKVDVRKGFFMDGSSNIFKSVNLMISHYMSHSIQNPDVMLKLPKVLREANDPSHFKFFENLRSDFWKTSLPNKSIDEIWLPDASEDKKIQDKENELSESNPPLPPRGYITNDINFIQGLADIQDDEKVYHEIIKEKRKPKMTEVKPEVSPSNVYSELWMHGKDVDASNKDNIDQTESNYYQLNNSISISSNVTVMTALSEVHGFFDQENNELREMSLNVANKESFSIKEIIRYYFPQIINLKLSLKELYAPLPSLKEDIENFRKTRTIETIQKPEPEKDIVQDESEEYYAIPWELKYPWISKLMVMDNSNEESETKCMEEILKANSLQPKHNPSDLPFPKSKPLSNSSTSLNSKGFKSNSNSERESTVSTTDDEEDEEDINDSNLQKKLLADIQPVMMSPSTKDQNITPTKFLYGKSIRDYLNRLCSRKGNGEISNSVRMFIQCTMDRADLSPYTTMRLIRQYMSGLKNLIKQQKSEYSLFSVIEDERRKTPKNIFINLESIIESVLTKAVVKPLTSHIYRLLVLEHYKNINLKLISDGVEVAKNLEPEKLGLQNSSIPIIQNRLKVIKNRFRMMSKQYSPEKKIGHLISIIEIVFQLVKQIHPDEEIDSLKMDFKTDQVLPILVYIFSQCKMDAIAAQSEVEYIEGLIWSSTLVNGEPGFYLMNLMSSLEAIKVLARPQINSSEMIDLSNKNPTKVNNSAFYSKINPSTLSSAAVGSVNVIILDEKVNRLITKTFPVRSTVTVGTLCNSIAHRLGIFNPKEYNLYKFTGTEDILLDESALPLQIKQEYQQKTGETMNFLFKRNNAIFILPNFIDTK